MKKSINHKNESDMKFLKFFLAALAGFGLVKLVGYMAEPDFDEEGGEFDIYDEDEYPLFV